MRVLNRSSRLMLPSIKVIVVGALVNVKGELIGINAVLTSPTGANVGYGFAIPSNIMKKVVTDLKEFGTVQRAMLGIEGSSLPDLQSGEVDEEELSKTAGQDERTWCS
jgi:S1-C subfamily serine protease